MNMCISPYGGDRAILKIESGPEERMPTCYKCPGNAIIDIFVYLSVRYMYVCIFSKFSSKTAFIIGKVYL